VQAVGERTKRRCYYSHEALRCSSLLIKNDILSIMEIHSLNPSEDIDRSDDVGLNDDVIGVRAGKRVTIGLIGVRSH
jgi:hypothetical protein